MQGIRDRIVVVMIVALALLGVTSLVGGVAMIAGDASPLGLGWLRLPPGTPGALVPSIVLVVVGVGSPAAAVGLWLRRRHRAQIDRRTSSRGGAGARRTRVLVAHAGTRATTAGIPGQVGDRLRAHLLDVDVVPARAVRDVDRYDVVVVGGAVVRGRWHRHARRFVRRHGDALADRPVWVFSCGEPQRRSNGDPRVRGVRRAMTRVGARGHAVFDGAVIADASPFVARAAPTAGADGEPDHVPVVDQWADRVGRSIAWEHGVRRDVIRGVAMPSTG